MKSFKQFVAEYRLPVGDHKPVNKKGKKKKTVEVMPKVPDGPRGNENEGNRDDRGK
tara:strand:+ start:1778 stop:1945 length:168 start_codon:yes stop_codon:yes gene_type:complete